MAGVGNLVKASLHLNKAAQPLLLSFCGDLLQTK